MARLTIPDEQTFAEFSVVTPTSVFPFTFSIFAKADLTVLVDEVALDQSAFTLSGAVLEGGGYDGGSVTLNASVNEVTVRVERNIAPARTSNFAPANSTPVGSIDQALNRLTAGQQDLGRRVGETRERLEDAIEEAGSAIGLIGKVDKTALAAATGSTLVGHTPSGTGGISRSLVHVLNDWSNSVVGFGATADSSTDNTLAFQRAMDAFFGKPIFVPPSLAGAYVVGNVGSILAAGTGVLGLSGYQTLIRAKPGLVAGSALFFNPEAGTNGTAYGVFSNLRFDLDGQDIIAIDLSHCDTFVVDHVNGEGGANLGTAAGTLVKFGAPSNSSSYNNVVRDCAGQYFAAAVLFGENANQNRVEGGSYTLNEIGIDCAPGGVLGRPQVLGARIESNGIGIKEGAQGGVYMGYFEDNTTGDFSFTTDSERCVILPGTTTGATATPLHNRANASNLRCLSYEMGYFDIQESQSNTAAEQGRKLRTVSGATVVPTFPNVDATDIHFGTLILGNGYGLEGGNAAASATVKMVSTNASNETEIVSLDRGASNTQRPVNIGAGPSVRPLVTATTDLGDSGRRWKDGYFSSNVFAAGSLSLEGAGSKIFINGVQVLAAQGAAVADATDAASAITQLNLLLARLRAHGQIAT